MLCICSKRKTINETLKLSFFADKPSDALVASQRSVHLTNIFINCYNYVITKGKSYNYWPKIFLLTVHLLDPFVFNLLNVIIQNFLANCKPTSSPFVFNVLNVIYKSFLLTVHLLLLFLIYLM